jgi:hypothetical protein
MLKRSAGLSPPTEEIIRIDSGALPTVRRAKAMVGSSDQEDFCGQAIHPDRLGHLPDG